MLCFKNRLRQNTIKTMADFRKNRYDLGIISGDNVHNCLGAACISGMINAEQEDIYLYDYKDGILSSTALEEDFAGATRLDFTKTLLRNKESSNLGESTGRSLLSQRTQNLDETIGHLRRRVGAIDGEAFGELLADCGIESLHTNIELEKYPILQKVAHEVRIYSRMNPEQKAFIVKIMKAYYKSKEYTVGFCGDGANDCIALKEADIGVSLSKTEASFSAPFLSLIEDISCMAEISIQGKAALTTNMDTYRFYSIYSVIEGIGMMFLYFRRGDYQESFYIYVDVAIGWLVGWWKADLPPADGLTREFPDSTLFTKEHILSHALNHLFGTAMFFWAYFIARIDENYISPGDGQDEAGTFWIGSIDSTVRMT